MTKYATEENFNFHDFDLVPNFVLKAIRADIAQICFPEGFSFLFFSRIHKK